MPVLALCWARWSEASIWLSWLRDRVSSSRSVRGEAQTVIAGHSAMISVSKGLRFFMAKFLNVYF